MNRRTFYRKLREHAPDFTWQCHNGEIRGQNNGFPFCPITAVAFCEKNLTLSPKDYNYAAESLGLSENDRNHIICISDWPTAEFDMINEGSHAFARRNLERAVGLATPSQNRIDSRA